MNYKKQSEKNIQVEKQLRHHVYTLRKEAIFKKTKGPIPENKISSITWISDKAEFTPKTIQTKDERANMVYAMKIKMKNDGSYKIGMYGEINF